MENNSANIDKDTLISQLIKENSELKKTNSELNNKLKSTDKELKNKIFLEILFNNLLKHLPDSIYFKNIKSQFIEVSQSMLDLFNLELKSDMIGKTDFDFHDPRHASEAYEDEQEILKSGKPIIGISEKEYYENNIIRWVSTTKIPLKNKRGKTIGVFGISRDITEMKILEDNLVYKNEELQAAEEELRQNIEELKCTQESLLNKQNEIQQTNKELKLHKEKLEFLVQNRTRDLLIAKEKAEENDNLKSAFLANMSHEIRTPMNAIIGFANLLKSENLNSAQEEFAEKIIAGGESLMDLLNNVLDFSLIEVNQLQLVQKQVGIKNIADEIFKVAQRMEHTKSLNLTLINELKDEHLCIISDEHRLKQVLLNIIHNAIKYTHKGSIEFKIKQESKHVVFSIKDSGIGIPEDKLDSIFEGFRKVEIYKETTYRGAGLGLTIAKNLTHMLKGDLKVESNINIGSCFHLYIPLQE